MMTCGGGRLQRPALECRRDWTRPSAARELHAAAGGPLKDPGPWRPPEGSWTQEASGLAGKVVDNNDNNNNSDNTL